VKITVTKVGTLSTSITWPVDVPGNQRGHHVDNGGLDDNKGTNAEWPLDVMLSRNPTLEAIPLNELSTTDPYHTADELVKVMNGSIPSGNYVNSDVDETTQASFPWDTDLNDPGPWIWREAITFNTVTFAMPSAPDAEHGVDINVKFVYLNYTYALQPTYSDTTVGPLKLRIKNVVPPGTVSLDPIADADTTTTSVTLSWSQYDDPTAAYFRYYWVEYRLSGGHVAILGNRHEDRHDHLHRAWSAGGDDIRLPCPGGGCLRPRRHPVQRADGHDGRGRRRRWRGRNHRPSRRPRTGDVRPSGVTLPAGLSPQGGPGFRARGKMLHSIRGCVNL
jgi:hypothetical protein